MGAELPILPIGTLYDFYYMAANAVLRHYNPCEATVKDGQFSCVAIRPLKEDLPDKPWRKGEIAYKGACCGADVNYWRCKQLGPQGCTTENLACKLWLCVVAQALHPEAMEALNTLRRAFEDTVSPVSITHHFFAKREAVLQEHHRLEAIKERNVQEQVRQRVGR